MFVRQLWREPRYRWTAMLTRPNLITTQPTVNITRIILILAPKTHGTTRGGNKNKYLHFHTRDHHGAGIAMGLRWRFMVDISAILSMVRRWRFFLGICVVSLSLDGYMMEISGRSFCRGLDRMVLAI